MSCDMRWRFVLCLCLSISCVTADAQDPANEPPPANDGTIQQVTLYRSQALVTRRIEVPAGDGLRVVKVGRLPELLVPDSVYAEGEGTTEVRAVRVSGSVESESQREDVRALESEIEELGQQLAAVSSEAEVVAQDLQFLDGLMGFTATTSAADLNRGVLDAEALIQLTEFSMAQRRELAAQKLQLQQSAAALTEQLNVKQRRHGVLVKGRQTTVYQAEVFLETAAGAEGTLQLSYLVNGCGWSPQYTIRGSLGEDTFAVRYSALVSQMSGETWEGVELTLSTASPSVSSSGPTLTPFRVTLDTERNASQEDPFAQAPNQSAVAEADLSERLKSLRAQQRTAETRSYGKETGSTPIERDLTLNTLAGQMQQIELQAEARGAANLTLGAADDVASQVYRLSQPVSLNSRREQQLVQIAEANLTGQLYHVATPLLSSYAYREAELQNSQPIGLLGGPASVYLDDRFVGRTEIPTTASGQRLLVGFGADQQVRTRRELLAKEDEIQGGNRRLRFQYRLVLSNFKDRPVKVRLMDRMPVATELQQISVRLEPPQQPLSEDRLYQRILQPRGILRWDVEVDAGQHGSDAFDVEYAYTIEFDRSRSLSSGEMQQQMEADYMEMQLPSGMGGMGGGVPPQP